MAYKIKRIKPRMWLGNNMGYDPAEYGIMSGHSQMGQIQFFAGDWNVVWNNGSKDRYANFRDARRAALDMGA